MRPKKKFSAEARAAVVREYLGTEKSAREISAEFGVSTASIARWVREVRDLADETNEPIGAVVESWAVEDEAMGSGEGRNREFQVAV